MTNSMMFKAIAVGILLITSTTAAEPQNENENVPRKIPLSQIFSTSQQKGLQNVRSVFQQEVEGQAANAYFRQLFAGTNGSSNVFLVDAVTSSDALAATLRVISGSHSADKPPTVNKSDPIRGNYWLVAYLGTASSSPPRWTIETVSVETNRVIVRYRKAKPSFGTEDSQSYYYWIPLGKLAPQAYEIQLVNDEQSVVNLMRRVEVSAK